MEFLDYEGLKQYNENIQNLIEQNAVGISNNSLPYSSFNKNEYSLTLGYDSNNKLEIQVVKDLAYALTLSASPTSVWYGSSPTITFTVRANDYTRGAKSWTFQATGDSKTRLYAALSKNGTQEIEKAYSTVKADITGTLTVDTETSTTIKCYIPILYSTSQFEDQSSYTSFSSTTNLIGKQYVTNGSYSFDSITPSNNQTTLYVAIPGEIDSIKYQAENTSNETPSIGTITLKINGQDVTYSIFKPCGTVPGSTFKLYK